MFVFLNSYDYIKEGSQNPLLSDRPRNYMNEELNIPSGILWSSGETWKQNRHLVISILRKFRVGNETFEENILRECMALIQELYRHKNATVDVNHMLTSSVSNIICSVLFGKRFEYSDERFQKLLLLTEKMTEKLGAGSLDMLTPFAKYVNPTAHRERLDIIIAFRKFYKDTIILDNNADDFNKEHNVSTASVACGTSKESMAVILEHLFEAATETTSNTLRWSLLYMIEYPEIQSRVQEELDNVIGRGRLPDLTDMEHLPYTQAVLCEVQRIAIVVPLIPHCARETTQIKSFTIPKGTYVISNLWALLNDPAVWEEPRSFRPSRFLDESGHFRQRREFIPFSIGRRVCVGENLAKMEMNIFFTHMLHHFTFTKPKDSPPLSFDGVVGVTNAPAPFEVEITDRK